MLYCNMAQCIYKNQNHSLELDEALKAFTLSSGTGQGYLPSPFLFNTVKEILDSGARQ